MNLDLSLSNTDFLEPAVQLPNSAVAVPSESLQFTTSEISIGAIVVKLIS